MLTVKFPASSTGAEIPWAPLITTIEAPADGVPKVNTPVVPWASV